MTIVLQARLKHLFSSLSSPHCALNPQIRPGQRLLWHDDQYVSVSDHPVVNQLSRPFPYFYVYFTSWQNNPGKKDIRVTRMSQTWSIKNTFFVRNTDFCQIFCKVCLGLFVLSILTTISRNWTLSQFIHYYNCCDLHIAMYIHSEAYPTQREPTQTWGRIYKLCSTYVP